MSAVDRRKKIINVCLETFMEKGFMNTPTKELCKALNMQTGGIFYHFATKDEIVLACAEEAKERIERDLFGAALKNVYDPDALAKTLYDNAIKMRPLMKFFVCVCATAKYDAAVQEMLDKLSERYDYYIRQFAEKLLCKPEEVAPHVYTVINTMLSYMLFGKSNFVAPQLDVVYKVLNKILKEKSLYKKVS